MLKQILNFRTFIRAVVYSLISALVLGLTFGAALMILVAGGAQVPSRSSETIGNLGLIGVFIFGLIALGLPIAAGYYIARSEHQRAKQAGMNFGSDNAALSAGATLFISGLLFLFIPLLRIGNFELSLGKFGECLVGAFFNAGLGAAGGVLFISREGKRKMDSSTIESDAQTPAAMPVADEARVHE